MGRNTSTHANDGIGAGYNTKFAQEGFEAWASNGVKGVFSSSAGFLFYYAACAIEGTMFKEESHRIGTLGVCPCKCHFREELVKSREETRCSIFREVEEIT